MSITINNNDFKIFSENETSKDQINSTEVHQVNLQKETNNIIKSRKFTLSQLHTVPEGVENPSFIGDNIHGNTRPHRELLTSTLSKESITTFKQKLYGTIDVWWLYDDGGKYLVLVPNI